MEAVDNSTKIPFKVSARTAKLIGLENFSNEEGAIVELVKNTYDADSKNCIIVFDLKHKIVEEGDKRLQVFDKENSRIYIVDNGIGMTNDIIKDQWMTIGTDNKLYEHTSEGGRVKTGAKGIGRFALNRLGLLTDMLTITSGGTGFEWLVDWRDFDKIGASVSDVEAVLLELNDFDLKKELLTKFGNYNRLIDLIENISFESGTLIEISELNDNWELGQLERLFGNLEMLLPPKEQSDFKIDFFTTTDIGQFGTVKRAYYDDFDYKIEAVYDDTLESDTLEVKITRNELDIDAIKNRHYEVFEYEQMSNFPYRKEDFLQKTITLKKNLKEILSNDIDGSFIDQIGKFGFTFYFLKISISDDKADGDLKKYPYKSINTANRRAWLKKFGGIKIFRDDFRIRPYGEQGEDWLRLGERQAQSPGGAGQRLGGYRIGPNQIAGTINISRIHNLRFQDKSGREGIIENDVFELFKNIIKEIIGFFEKDRNVIMYNLSELYKKKNKEAEALRKAQAEAERIAKEEEAEKQKKEQEGQGQEDQNNEDGAKETNDDGKESESTSSGDASDVEKTLAAGVQILTKSNEQKDAEIRLLRSLASVGLIISSFAHEVKSLRSRLIPRTTFLLRELHNYINEKELDHVKKDDNPFYMIRLIQDEDTKLKHWLDYSLNTLKRDKRERTNLDFGEYFDRFKATWSKALEQRNITIRLEGVKESCIIRAFEVDMDSIFNNLLSNAINALKGKIKREKMISISWGKVDENVEITFSDSGKGLDERYKNRPEDIFNLNESSRTDNKGNVIGTGLGLYIVDTIIKEYNNSNISIIGIDDGLKFKIAFKTRA